MEEIIEELFVKWSCPNFLVISPTTGGRKKRLKCHIDGRDSESNHGSCGEGRKSDNCCEPPTSKRESSDIKR